LFATAAIPAARRIPDAADPLDSTTDVILYMSVGCSPYRHPGCPAELAQPQRAANAWLSWKRLQKRLGLGDHTIHDLRHTIVGVQLLTFV
jgi:hypothetical protein